MLPTSLKRWDIQNLDYNWYFALTIIGGFFGLDYMYLGSPLGAVTKTIFNLFTLGFWWYYDALNAAVSQDQVRLYGPSAPMFGLTGLAAGRFRDSKNPFGLENKLMKHTNFLLYGIILVSLGIIGGDSFLTGNFFNGVMRLFSLISMIGAPIAIFWWISNLYYYFLDTGSCIDQNWDYFGAPKPTNQAAECPSFLMIITVWIFKTILVLIELIPIIGPMIGPFLQAFIKKLELAYGFIAKGIEELKDAKDRAHDLLDAEKGRPLPKVIDLQVGMKPLPTPESCKLDESDLKRGTPEEVAAAAKGQEGGGELLVAENPLFGLLFLGAIGFVIVSSIVLSLRRSRQNAAAEQQSKAGQQPGDQETDVPPEPRNARVPPAVY